jgi:putative GTP pyrophosphokinase
MNKIEWNFRQTIQYKGCDLMDLPMFYDEAEEWNAALLLYDAALKEVNTKLEILNNEFKLAHQYNPIEHIASRIKTPQSIAKKLRHNQKELTVDNIIKYVNDVAGIRVICSFTSDIYRIADLISKQSDIKVLKVKDYIMCPKENGYTSYHMIISIPVFLTDCTVETKVEIQIRTIAMDFWASLEHKIYYKFEGNAPEHIRKELKECSDIVAYLDQKMLTLNEEIKILSKDHTEGYQQELVSSYKTVVAESFGTVIEEEQEVKEIKEAEEEGTQKTGKKRMLFGFRA